MRRPWHQRAPLRSHGRPDARVIMGSAAASVDRMEHPTFDLTGQVALVTGASRGIGHALVLALAAAGATVAAGARSAADVADLVEQVRAEGGRAVAVELDVTDLAGIEAAVQRLVADLGRIDILVNKAGLVGIRRHAVYSAGKGGVNMLTRVLALEWAPHGVTVNAVAPTFIRTPGTAERLGDPEFAAVAAAVIY